MTFDVDLIGVLGRQVLRERAAALIAEACAWSVGLSDQPWCLMRSGRVVPGGATLGARAEAGLPLSGDDAGRIELGDARPGSFQDALNALGPDGAVVADRFDAEVVEPFVHDTCVAAAERARRTRPAAWLELLEELGEDDDADLADVVRSGEWESSLRTEAEQLVLAALSAVPLIEVEAEGLPLSLVRAAEAETRRAAVPEPLDAGGLAGALYLAQLAVQDLPSPVPEEQAGPLLDALLEQGLEPDEIRAVLEQLPVTPGTLDRVGRMLDDRTGPA
ncbi:MAG: hypothetical protein ACXV0U_12435 [Kineosporiaceae bacterium]